MNFGAKGGGSHDKLGDIYESVIDTRRVTKVVKGGSRLSFSVLLLAGNKRGRVGYAICKDREIANARIKASKAARRCMVRISLKESRTLHHDVKATCGATTVMLRSAKPGSGVVAGGALRQLFELLGVHDVTAKIEGSTCPHNVVRAGLLALSRIDTPKMVAYRLSKRVDEIVARRNIS